MIDFLYHTQKLLDLSVDELTIPIDIDHAVAKTLRYSRKTSVSCTDVDLESFIARFNRATKSSNDLLDTVLILSLRPLLSEIDHDQFDTMLSMMIHDYNTSRVVPGDAVGVMASESMAEGTTQGCLNQFHSTGVSTKETSMGLPRISELIDNKSSIAAPSMSFRLIHNINNPIERLTKLLCKSSVNDFVDYTNDDCTIIQYLPTLDDISRDDSDYQWLMVWRELTSIEDVTSFLSVSSYVVNIKLKHVLPYRLQYIANLFETMIPGSRVIHSAGINGNVLHIRSSILEATLNDGKVDDISIMKNIWVTQDQYRHMNMVTQPIRSRMKGKTIEYLINSNETEECKMETKDNVVTCHKFMSDILSKTITPPSNITGVFESDTIPGEFETNGCDLDVVIQNYTDVHYKNVYREHNQIIDWKTVIPNDVRYTIQKLGIEAGCIVLFRELRAVLGFDGAYQNPRHIMMLVDCMTQSGIVSPLTRHGITSKNSSIIARATFEESVSHFSKAAINETIDNVVGCSERILTGRLIQSGTGMMDSDLLIDEEMLKSALVFDDDYVNIQESQNNVVNNTIIYNYKTPERLTTDIQHHKGIIHLSPIDSGLGFSPIRDMDNESVDSDMMEIIRPSSPWWSAKSPSYNASEDDDEDKRSSSPWWSAKSPSYNASEDDDDDGVHKRPLVNSPAYFCSELDDGEVVETSPGRYPTETITKRRRLDYSPSSPSMDIMDENTGPISLIGPIVENSMGPINVDDLMRNIDMRIKKTGTQTPANFRVNKNIIFNL